MTRAESRSPDGAETAASTRTLGSMALPAFIPALIFEVGNGAIAPIIVLTATDLGASAGWAAFMLALLGIGRLLGDLPAAWLADRVGDRRSMILAALVSVAAFFGCLVAPSLLVLGAALVVAGVCSATFYLARQSYLIDVAPVALRARAMSTLAGSHRIGLFVGPFVGSVAITFLGLRGAYVVAMIAAAGVVVLLLLVRDVPAEHDQPAAVRGGVGSAEILRTHWRLFVTLGTAVIAVAAVRAARQTVLPLWAEHIGLSAEQTSLVFGIANAVDMALFYPAGKVMDSHGRLAIALPAMIVLGTSMMLLPLTGSILSLTLVAMAMGLGNGIGSGIMMTLGADAAPVLGRVRFLGIWRLVGDVGNAAGPVLVSVVETVWALAEAIVGAGSLGLLAAAGLAAWVPRYSAYATPRSVRPHRRGG
jgi:MFS family permease